MTGGLTLPLLCGVAIALATGIFARLTGFDRDRSFYATLLIVVAHYYDLFAILGGSAPALGAETVGFAAFAVAAIIGYYRSRWILVAGLAGHGVFDYFHPLMIVDPGVPLWWPAFCLAFDVVAAAWLARIILIGPNGTAARRPRSS